MSYDIRASDLSDLIGLVYDSALEEDQWCSLKERLHQMFPGFWSGTVAFIGPNFLPMDPASFYNEEQALTFRALYPSEVDGPFSDAIDPSGFIEDIQKLQGYTKPTLGMMRRSRNVWSDDALRQTNFYKKYLSRFNLGPWTGVLTAISGDRYAILMFMQHEIDPRDKDMDGLDSVLELLAPHLVRSARFARVLHLARDAAETYRGFLDAIALPMIVVDRQGVVQLTNKAGQKLIDRGDVFQMLREAHISLDDPHEDRAFRTLLKRAKESSAPRGMRLDRDEGVVSLCVLPFHPSVLSAQKADRYIFDKQQLFAVFAGSTGKAPVNAGLLRDVFGLTAREAEVSRAVLAGQSPAQIAQATGRAEKTIRNQMQMAYDKIGVGSAREMGEALSVFRMVGAMFETDPPTRPHGALPNQ